MAAFPYYDAAAHRRAERAGRCDPRSCSRARGYAREEPSVLQPAEIFLDRSGEEIRRRTFTLTDPSGRDLCLRPDLTIPICQHAVRQRRAASRRASATTAWSSAISRASRTAPPSSSRRASNCWAWTTAPRAKREILSLAFEALRAAGLKDFELRFGDLALFGALVDALDIAARNGARA